MIDLHAHSTASDGTLAPEELVDLAAETGLAAIALTDHDTLAGVPAAVARGKERGVDVVPGLELGLEWEKAGAMHLLGYFVPPEDEHFCGELERLRQIRLSRGQRIVEKLKGLGMEISFERVEEISGGNSLGRPHVARALVEQGAVANVNEAFDRYLSKGRSAYVQREMLTPEQGIRLIKSVGGVAVLAHPGTLKLGGRSLAKCVEELQGYGLDGIEVIWSGHNQRKRHALQALAQRLGLLATGGSDFHGESKPGIKLGRGLHGNVQVPDSVLAQLRERRATA
jgi:predicted metal-dependent phosphoesterase TrpH